MSLAHRVQSASRETITAVLDNRFDGDALNFSLAIDNFLANELRHLAPHKSTFDMAKPYNISNNLSKPKPVIATFSNWMGTQETTPASFEQMEAMTMLANL